MLGMCALLGADLQFLVVTKPHTKLGKLKTLKVWRPLYRQDDWGSTATDLYLAWHRCPALADTLAPRRGEGRQYRGGGGGGATICSKGKLAVRLMSPVPAARDPL